MCTFLPSNVLFWAKHRCSFKSTHLGRTPGDHNKERQTQDQTWLSLKDAVPARLNPFGQNDENNCLACVAWLAHLAQSQ